MPNAIASILCACRGCIAISILLLLQTGFAWTGSEDIHLAARYCANETSPAKLSEDGMILCFDGPIQKEAPIDQIQRLNDHGVFVVRSPGGAVLVAMKIADILMDKDATVVVRDYCLSACAAYFLVASRRTHVLRDTVVAWHGWWPRDPACDMDEGPSALGEYVERRCEVMVLHREFFRRRGIESRHVFSPRTTYTRMMLNTLVKTQGHRSQFLWMWNPKNYGDYFKDRVVYESYPGSQDEVNAIIKRLRVGRPDQIIYDPDL